MITRTLLIGLAGSLAFSSTAFAEFDQITKGVRDGALTPQEVHVLYESIAQIKEFETEARTTGRFTLKERLVLRKMKRALNIKTTALANNNTRLGA